MGNISGETGNLAMPPRDPRFATRKREVIYHLPETPSLNDVAALHDIGCEHHNLFAIYEARHDIIRAKDALELAQETYAHLPIAEQTSHAGRYWAQEVQRALCKVRQEWEDSATWDV